MIRMLVFAMLAVCAACSPQSGAEASSTAAAQQDVHPVSGLQIVPLTVTNGTNKTHKFKVEVASTPAEQARGLMFRTELGPDEGMIFPREDNAQASFWMKNTPLPLDIIFVGPDGRISNIAANTEPYSLKAVTSDGIAGLVLEIPGGRAAELGIVPGDRVKW